MNFFGGPCSKMGNLKILCKDKLNPVKYIIIALYDYLHLPMCYYKADQSTGRPCQGSVVDYGTDRSDIDIKHNNKLTKLKNSLKKKIIDFFLKQKGLTVEDKMKTHVTNIINAEEEIIKGLKQKSHKIPIFCNKAGGSNTYRKQPDGHKTKYSYKWKFDKEEGIKEVLEWDVSWFKLNDKRNFIKGIFENEEMPIEVTEIFKNIIDEKKDKDIPKILEVANKFRDEVQQLKYEDEVLLEWIKGQLDVYTPPEVVNQINEGHYDNYVEWLATQSETNKNNNYSAQYKLKF